MARTGESYATARARLLERGPEPLSVDDVVALFHRIHRTAPSAHGEIVVWTDDATKERLRSEAHGFVPITDADKPPQEERISFWRDGDNVITQAEGKEPRGVHPGPTATAFVDPWRLLESLELTETSWEGRGPLVLVDATPVEDRRALIGPATRLELLVDPGEQRLVAVSEFHGDTLLVRRTLRSAAEGPGDMPAVPPHKPMSYLGSFAAAQELVDFPVWQPPGVSKNIFVAQAIVVSHGDVPWTLTLICCQRSPGTEPTKVVLEPWPDDPRIEVAVRTVDGPGKQLVRLQAGGTEIDVHGSRCTTEDMVPYVQGFRPLS